MVGKQRDRTKLKQEGAKRGGPGLLIYGTELHDGGAPGGLADWKRNGEYLSSSKSPSCPAQPQSHKDLDTAQNWSPDFCFTVTRQKCLLWFQRICFLIVFWIKGFASEKLQEFLGDSDTSLQLPPNMLVDSRQSREKGQNEYPKDPKLSSEATVNWKQRGIKWSGVKQAKHGSIYPANWVLELVVMVERRMWRREIMGVTTLLMFLYWMCAPVFV